MAQNIIFDTNVLQYFNNSKIASGLIDYLKELANKSFTFSMSDISLFEILVNVDKTKEEKLINTLKVFLRFAVSSEVLIAAAQLSTLYRKEDSNQIIEVGDKIIAATAIITNSLILTANCNDFLRPFFLEKEVRKIFYYNKKKEAMIVMYLLKPDLATVSMRFSERP